MIYKYLLSQNINAGFIEFVANKWTTLGWLGGPKYNLNMSENCLENSILTDIHDIAQGLFSKPGSQ